MASYRTVSANGSGVEVVHHADNRFYELLVEGQFAGLVVYEATEDRYVFTHTFIAEGYRGRGLSQVLIRGALDDVRARQVTATNRCPIMDRFVEKNPEYGPLISTGQAASRESS
jgi:predicted GNAT family acetyltransferase